MKDNSTSEARSVGNPYIYLLCSFCLCVHRCSLMGFDLNRHWANPSPWAHPTLHGVKQLIVEMYNNPVSGEGNSSLRCLLLWALCKPAALTWLNSVAN